MATKDSPEEPTSADIDPATYVTIHDGDLPAGNMKAKNISAQVLQMSTGFDVNGEIGNPGDWLVCIGTNWHIFKEL